MSQSDNNSRLAAVYIQINHATNAEGVLGFEYQATPDELRGAYRELVFLLHPDKCTEDLREYHTELFQKVSAAFVRLTLGTNKKNKVKALPETPAALRARVWDFQQKRREEAEQKKVEDARLRALRAAKQAKYVRETTKSANARVEAETKAKAKMSRKEAEYQKQVAWRKTKEIRRLEQLLPRPMEVVMSAANVAATLSRDSHGQNAVEDPLAPENVALVQQGLDEGWIKAPDSAPKADPEPITNPKLRGNFNVPLEKKKLRNKPQTTVRLLKGNGTESMRALLLDNGAEEASEGTQKLLQASHSQAYKKYLDWDDQDDDEDSCELLTG